MSGHRPFRELTKDWPAKRRLRVEQRKESLLRDIEQGALVDLRKALRVSQEELAHALGKSQAAIAQMEQRPVESLIGVWKSSHVGIPRARDRRRHG